MWTDHWGISRDPFVESDSTYVSLPSHDEAVARLSYMIETSRRQIVFHAPAGMGKSTVLRKVISEIRNPRRKVVAIPCPTEGTLLFARLAERLGNRLGRDPDRLKCWMALDQSIRAASLQGTHVVLMIDDCHQLTTDSNRRDLDSLVQLGTSGDADLTIVQAARPDRDRLTDPDDGWMLAVSLLPLTRSQVETYLTTKLRAVGYDEPIFTPRAITRLQALSEGIPRRIQEIAALSLMAGALRGLEMIPPDLIDSMASQIGVIR